MRSERISRLAARRQQYTNETYQQAWSLLPPGASSASGLLRHLGLFHTLTAADAVTGYKGLASTGTTAAARCAGAWTSSNRSGIRSLKQNLIEAVTDPESGAAVHSGPGRAQVEHVPTY